MSLALKKNNFRVEIRRQNIANILKHKKQQYQAQKQVNQILQQYLEHYLDRNIPQLCALKFEFIEPEKVHKLLDLIKEKKVKLDLTKPQNIALINKLARTDYTLIIDYFQEVTLFAEKITFTLKSYHISKNHQSQSSSKQGTPLQSTPLPSKLLNAFIYMPNCLLEFWATFFSIQEEKPSFQMKAYCTILRSFINWFSDQSFQTQIFNKYSLCSFIRNFFQFQRIFVWKGNEKAVYRQVQELHIRFRIASMPVILRLLEEGCFCQELVDVMVIIKGHELLAEDLLRRIRQKECLKGFFELILGGLDNENCIINKKKQVEKKYLQSESLTQEQLQTLEQLSIESVLVKNISESIWRCKANTLEVFNGFLCCGGYQNLLFHSQIQQILQKLIMTYAYCTQRGYITSQVQKTICLILYNIWLHVQNQSQYSTQEQTCLIIHIQQQVNVQQRLKEYVIEHVGHISLMISKTQYTAQDHVIELINLLQYMSQFVHRKQLDEAIMIEGGLVGRVCWAIKEMKYNCQESEKIFSCLFDLLEQLNENEFDFRLIGDELMQLRNAHFDSIINDQQDRILKRIISSLQ